MLKMKIYSGLSLLKSDVERILPQATFAPPIKRGDLINDVKSGYQIVGIVDGEFFQALALSPAEVLDALRCGLTLFGSSSMGALRAAELDRFGMIGVGEIYEYIKSTEHFADDHLGQIFFEGRIEKSMTFVDFHFACLDLESRKKISKSTRTALMQVYSRLHFSERSLEQARSVVSRQRAPKNLLQALDLVGQLKMTAKTRDGLSLLQTMRAHIDRIRIVQDQLN